MQNLFVYGSLLFRELVFVLTGKLFSTAPAILPDFERFAIKNRDYPAVIPQKSKYVEGTVYLNVDEDAMEILSFFEADEYEKMEVEVISENRKIKAIAYIWRESVELLEAFDWDKNKFEASSLLFYLQKVAPETVREFYDSQI